MGAPAEFSVLIYSSGSRSSSQLGGDLSARFQTLLERIRGHLLKVPVGDEAGIAFRQQDRPDRSGRQRGPRGAPGDADKPTVLVTRWLGRPSVPTQPHPRCEEHARTDEPSDDDDHRSASGSPVNRGARGRQRVQVLDGVTAEAEVLQALQPGQRMQLRQAIAGQPQLPG